MIVVFGSINVDLVFAVERLPKPGETAISPGYRMFHGGKGANQAVAASRAGAHVEMVGCVGDDSFGAAAREALCREGVGVHHVRTMKTQTGCAAIGVDADGQNQILVGAGANERVSHDDLPEELLTSDTLLLLQLEVPADANWAAAAKAKARGARVILNAAPAAAIPDHVMSLLDMLVVNEFEVASLAGALEFGADTPLRCGEWLAQRYEIDVVVTLGARGAVLCGPREQLEIPAPSIVPVDTVGAGDTFCGVLAAFLDFSLDRSDALLGATVAGALSCLKKGARGGMPTAMEIEHARRDANLQVRPRRPTALQA